MELYVGKMNEQAELEAFYENVIQNTKEREKYCRWKLGSYPTNQDIQNYLEGSCMYIARENGEIKGAVAITEGQSEDYRKIDWRYEVQDSEIQVLHMLAVDPGMHGNGYGRSLISQTIMLAKEKNMKVIRLDALESNLPARHLYESLEFEMRGMQKLYADNTGWTNFVFYEKWL